MNRRNFLKMIGAASISPLVLAKSPCEAPPPTPSQKPYISGRGFNSQQLDSWLTRELCNIIDARDNDKSQIVFMSKELHDIFRERYNRDSGYRQGEYFVGMPVRINPMLPIKTNTGKTIHAFVMDIHKPRCYAWMDTNKL